MSRNLFYTSVQKEPINSDCVGRIYTRVFFDFYLQDQKPQDDETSCGEYVLAARYPQTLPMPSWHTAARTLLVTFLIQSAELLTRRWKIKESPVLKIMLDESIDKTVHHKFSVTAQIIDTATMSPSTLFLTDLRIDSATGFPVKFKSILWEEI